MAPPTYRGPDTACAKTIGRALLAIAKVHPQRAQQLGALLRLARWSHELTRLWASKGQDPHCRIELLLNFCTSAPLRALATDEVLIGLIHRAMAEIDTEPGMLDILRIEYLCNELPQDLGLMAFHRLSAEQRLGFVEASCGLAINPYMRAVAQASDIPPERSALALQNMIERMEDDDGQHAALPALRGLKDELARGGAPA